MAQLESIRVYPIKSLDGVTVSEAEIVENGGLSWDRRYAIVEQSPKSATGAEPSGRYVNGKRERRVHGLEATYDLERETVTVGERDGDERHTFHLDLDRDGLTAWLSEFFGYPVDLVRDDEGGFPDDTDASGPTVISTGTLEAVAGWYSGIDAVEMCRRLRPNLVLDAPAFWEDRLYEAPGRVVPFDLGATTLQGVNPCQRCVVPTRDPDTGESTDGFRETFVERRAATLPEWASEDWFDHYFRLMVNTHVPDASQGATLKAGDAVTVGENRHQ
ncbi:MOSC domain-containing protein [Natronorubrum sulfidifaciens]|uniref:MOSC domain-containing protein beta barrel domain-containing protein n=1 Tax=Natronorubrum sulfidifaciens JCM 14089 TaxID=1230460 RepID=L9W2E8_9EURY|nr:MOSC N-terminal beta barrel domain-containing protein [Natronorubrum sulfidifaciens]ELY43471.1 MOSC domain-containing protein beta barrel domain-containing protein [Natronorubrum sulfidifaciens JCM 14089]